MQTRRKARSDHLGEASVSAAGRESLSDYTNLTEVAQGRFSVVYYAENKVGGEYVAPRKGYEGGGGTRCFAPRARWGASVQWPSGVGWGNGVLN